MTSSQIEAVKVWGNYMVNVAIKNAEETNRMRIESGQEPFSITDEVIDNCRKIKEEGGNKLAELILTKDGLYKKFCAGAFHPCNSASRKLLESLYGIELPKQSGKTREVIKTLIGKDFIAEKVRKADEKRGDEEKKAKEAKEAEHIAYILPLVDKVSEGESIGGSELVDVAKHLGIKVHIRTQGTLNQRISWVNGEQCSFSRSKSGKYGNPPESIYKLYRKCRAIILNCEV